MKNKRLLLSAVCCLAINFHLVAQTVTTHSYMARGATSAFGRSTMTGIDSKNLKERGFCWSSETNEPTVDKDAHTTTTLSQEGTIYHIEGLTPATVYYMRAYALMKDSTAYYGNTVKVITIPKGSISWSYNNGGPEADNKRINAAVKEAVEYLNEYTSISGFHTTVNYGAQTPTADCSYGGWMRVGPNASYQRTGTILHELLHGIGVGTHGVWNNNSPLRANGSSGTWLGDRVTEFIRFWDNNASSTLTGDGTHMWPYGINGAHEDSGSKLLYMGCSMIAQALGEDGLPPTGGFGTPAYVLNQEDTIKYYLKSESPDGGLTDSYLRQSKLKRLAWEQMTAEEAALNDSAAWYITFNPKTRYYQFRNAATGHYMTYYGTGASGFRLTDKGVALSNESFHLMRSRVDVDFGGSSIEGLRGYWIIHPENKQNPTCMTVSVRGLTTTGTFDLSNDAVKQRWLIVTANELKSLEEASQKAAKNNLDEAIKQLKELMQVPHIENIPGTDEAISTFITDIEEKELDKMSAGEIGILATAANDSCFSFLSKVSPADSATPFDLTHLIKNAGMDSGEGWSTVPAINYSCGEFYQKTFDMYQTLQGLPAGTYELCAQGFQRPGSSADSYNAYIAGNDEVVAYLYAGTKSVKLKHIASEARTTKIGTGNESAVGNPVRYMPNDMQATSRYFLRQLYENSVMTELKAKGNLKIGLRNSSAASNYWTIFDNFRLYYYGSLSPEEVAGIEQPIIRPNTPEALFATPADVYSITGICVRKQATSLDGLPRGFYIVKGRKVIVK